MVDPVCHLLVTHSPDHELGMGLIVLHKEDM
jgi:hypothetical protein